ncbi:hypothetical protein AB1L30_05800 [Bremerella sp. JC817]|uniref:hypothetical protein n=1 Tax=Bremerella sp. JC817 TaxID=3231756 RepID=UPI003458C4F3
MRARFYALAFSCLVFTLAGCGGDGIPRAAVKGTVTYDGKPIETGVIMFIPSDVSPIALKITDGIYDSESDVNDRRGAPIGDCQVQIFGDKPSGKIVTDITTGQKVEEFIQFIPPKYNVNSILTVTVEAGDQNIDFSLDN